MNEWSAGRKRFILSLIFFALLVLVGVPSFFLFYDAPTCFDGKKNGSETGVDCGGSCQLVCTSETLPLISRGDPRVLEIATSTYEVVALLDNPNALSEVAHARYSFRLYGISSSTPIKIIAGDTFIPKGSGFAVFQGPFNLEERPVRAVLEWQKETLIWKKNINPVPNISVKDVLLSKENTEPRLDARVTSNSLETVTNLELTALILNEEGTIFAASKTYIDSLPKGESAPVVFTWPRGFKEGVGRIELVPRIFPDTSYIR